MSNPVQPTAARSQLTAHRHGPPYYTNGHLLSVTAPATVNDADHRGRHPWHPHSPLHADSSPTTPSGAGRSLTASRASSPALRISTDVAPSTIPTSDPPHPTARASLDGGHASATSPDGKPTTLHPVAQTPSIKTALVQNFSSSASTTSSAAPSPVISAMGDMTPLPSPLLSADSPGPWKRLVAGTPPRSRARLGSVGEDTVLRTAANGSTPDTAAHLSATSIPKRKAYPSLDPLGQTPPALATRQHDQDQQNSDQHGRNRSISEYVPEPPGIPKRQATVSGPHAKKSDAAQGQELRIRREVNLAESRGMTPAVVANPPTPPPSESSKDSTDGPSTVTAAAAAAAAAATAATTRPKDDDDAGRRDVDGSSTELFEARGRYDGKKRRWRALRCLGQGTFSQVMLATSKVEPDAGESAESPPARKTLVAVKICEHGPRGGANEDRIEMSLKRELEILQIIHHPSLVDLKAWSIEPSRAILVLSYSAGGDLFDVATGHRQLLTPLLLRRVFSEIVGAVQYLHGQMIVHRDIKLENVLVNLTPSELSDPTTDWSRYPNSITTLADLGLSRRITPDEKLETRCGSDDYAAPEVIMGQPYDGRATDAWSLGVLLYALLESRLPFDPHPGMSDTHRMRSRTSHRIARVEWRWCEYGGDDGDHDGDEARFADRGLTGAMEVTEGLLKRARSRWPLTKVAEQPWVAGGVAVEGGLKFWEEQEGQVVA
ncbi:protein-serine/threonine kinase [Geosmithia morbida]|uniref:Protein-serine/threonine kinase n=1 Tax=Geosmithia morbida TaxID=1094350 RepID=A0A9P5CZP8_9HYPO|nr:protein-serine/threonine kinase [Geosmithia morbida]KAF4121833.1 protein-serine/threonine kinase [Geosmithia morbida]